MNIPQPEKPLQVLFLRRYNGRNSAFSFQLTHSGLDDLWRDNLTLTQTNYAYIISGGIQSHSTKSPVDYTGNTTEINTK